MREQHCYFSPHHHSFCSVMPPLLLTSVLKLLHIIFLHSCDLAVVAVVVVVSVPCCGGHEWLNDQGATLILAHSKLVDTLPS